MPDTKKSMPANGQSTKNGKDEATKGPTSKSKGNASNNKDGAKGAMKTSPKNSK